MYPLPWSIDLALVGLFFAYVGYIMRGVTINRNARIACMILSAIFIGLDCVYGGLDLNTRYYHHPILVLFGALAIIYWIKNLVTWSDKWVNKGVKFLRFSLAYLGMNSLVIMFVHMAVLEGESGWWLVGLRLVIGCCVIELLARNATIKDIFGLFGAKEVLEIYTTRANDR